MPRSASGEPVTHAGNSLMSEEGSELDIEPRHFNAGGVPCVDGSWLASQNFTSRAGRCSHVFGLLVRFA